MVLCLGPDDPVAALMVGNASAAAARSSKKRSNSEDEMLSSLAPAPACAPVGC